MKRCGHEAMNNEIIRSMRIPSETEPKSAKNQFADLKANNMTLTMTLFATPVKIKVFQ